MFNTTNIIKNNHASIIITDDLLEYYFEAIKNYDIAAMKNIFKIQSAKEHDVINLLIDEQKEIWNNKVI